MNIEYFLREVKNKELNIALIVSTFRNEVYDMYLAILEALSTENKIKICVFSAREYYNNTEYGDIKLEEVKKIKIWNYLKRKFKNISFKMIENEKVDIPINFELGIQSSLISETRDEYATKEKYPELYNSYFKLAQGGLNISKNLVGFDLVYIFNGRIASVRCIIDELKRLSINTRYLEWSFSANVHVPNDGHGIILNFSPHDGQPYCKLINNFYEENDKVELPYKISKSFEYLSNKFSNQFTANYNYTPLGNYTAVYFLSSNDEFSSIDESVDFMNKQINNIDLIACLNEKVKDIVICGHPNSALIGDKFNDLVKQKCSQYGFKFLDGNSKTNSYAMILKASKIYVDGSTIGVEAVALGKRLYYFGDPFYAGLIGLNANHLINDIQYPDPHIEMAGLNKIGYFMENYYWVKPPSFIRNKKFFVKKFAIKVFRKIIAPINYMIGW